MRNMLLQHWIFRLLFILDNLNIFLAHGSAALSAGTPATPQPRSHSEAAWAGSHYSPGRGDGKGIGVVSAEARMEFGCVSSGVNLASNYEGLWIL